MSEDYGNPAPEPRRDEYDRRWFALAILVMAQFVVILDASIVNVALPAMKAHLHFSTNSLQYVVTAYSITFGGLLLLGGRLADRFGRRLFFIAGVVVFTTASLLDAVSTAPGELIAFRAAQGVGAALLTPAALSLLVTIFREGAERNFALGIWGAAVGAGGATGALLGGVLTTELSWRWIFFINIPIGVAVTALSPLILPESRNEHAPPSFDFAGAATLTGGVMLLVYALTRAGQHGWGQGATIGPLVGAAALLLAFVAIELRAHDPLLPLRLFRLRALAASNLALVAVSAQAGAIYLIGALYTQIILGYTPIETGGVFATAAIATVLTAPIVQKMATRWGIRLPLAIGFAFVLISLLLFARLPVHGRFLSDLLPAFIASGLGMAFTFIPGQIGAQAGVEAKDSGIASGVINLSQNIGIALGVAVAITLATSATKHYVQLHLPATRMLVDTATVHGYHVAFYVLAGVTAATALLTMLLLQARRAQNAERASGATRERRPCAPNLPFGPPVRVTGASPHGS